MGLNNSQTRRLNLEKKIVRKKLGNDFKLLFDEYSEPYFAGRVITTCDRKHYSLTLYLGSDFPDEKPELYVTRPKRLKKHGGRGCINDMETSHAFHTLENSDDGCVQICHSEYWDATDTCVGVLLKGILWLEFYEAYLCNGGDIDQYCRQN